MFYVLLRGIPGEPDFDGNTLLHLEKLPVELSCGMGEYIDPVAFEMVSMTPR